MRDGPVRKLPASAALARRGFTLVELMITLTVLAVVLVVLTTVMYTAARSKVATANRIESSQASRVAVDMMARDLRSAGYGADMGSSPTPQAPFAYVDSLQVLIDENLNPFPDTTSVHLGPLAYNPTGSPRPFPLNGTSWTPPKKYVTGAEVVRWTLDVNNDGVVDQNDIADANGVDAQRTPNPNDYVLVRQVYGDSSGATPTPGNNGGSMERIALIKKPGGTVPPLFTVYMKGITTPWDWSSGPVPANQLQNIERVTIQVVAPSARADWRGQYAETKLKTEVYSIRNVPNFSTTEFNVSGYVFADIGAVKNGVQDVGEPGLSGVTVKLGKYLSTTTNSLGYYQFAATAGTYALRHTPPGGYKVETNPDSFVVTIGPSTARSFADTVIAGGWVTAKVFEDLDNDGVWDTNEPWREDEKLTLSPTGESRVTDAYGTTIFMSPVGAYTLTLDVPDSLTCTTSNPATGTMTLGGSQTKYFALKRQSSATVSGSVWMDKNSNGVYEGSESGIQNVWVGVTSNGGTNVLSFAFSDNHGNYNLTVPANSPPGTSPYAIEAIPPSGYYPTTAASFSAVLLTAGQTLSSKNFGMNSFQKITLNSARVLCLASGDLMEKDWSNNQAPQADADLILGADANGTDQISIWFNQYNSPALFSTNRSYARQAPNSVLCVAADSLTEDPAPYSGRLDIVTGTKLAGAGNLFAWYTQYTSGNEGYLPSTYSKAYKTFDNGDVQAVVTTNCTGGTGIDIIAGTKSPTAGQGTIEIWKSDDAILPSFSRLEIYPPSGVIPSNSLGEVTAMALADLKNSGKKDLVVGTRTGTYNGQVMIFSRKDSSFVYRLDEKKTITNGSVTTLACVDVNHDGRLDIVAGTQTGTAGGNLLYYRNKGTSVLSFSMDDSITAPGIPLSLAAGDLGGSNGTDMVLGWRTNETSYNGGVTIYYLDSGNLTGAAAVDPSGGTVTNMAPAVTVNNFNYGVKPAPPYPYQTDIAAGIKSSATTGALIVFVR